MTEAAVARVEATVGVYRYSRPHLHHQQSKGRRRRPRARLVSRRGETQGRQSHQAGREDLSLLVRLS